MVDSCRECDSCLDGLEQYCEKRRDRHLRRQGPAPRRRDHPGRLRDLHRGGPTNYVLRVPAKLDPAAVAPLLCAGITTYSPLRHFDVEEGDVVGVVGLGGLGHMAVKLAKAMGAVVTVFTTSAAKADPPVSSVRTTWSCPATTMPWPPPGAACDLIIDTVAAPHDLEPVLPHSGATARCSSWACRPSRCRRCRSPADAPAARLRRARSSAASPRPRRCWTSAPNTAWSPTSNWCAPTS